jgi:hypothetical protein
MNQRNETDLAVYNRYKQIIIEGYADMNIHYTTYVEEFKGTVNEANQMSVPADFIDYVMVAVEINGQYWPLDINNDLIIAQPNYTGVVVTFSEHFNPPDFSGSGYTTRRRNALGECKVDKRNRIIGFKGDFTGRTIYLNYISTGIETQGDCYIDRELLPVLKAYLNWVLTENNPQIAGSIKMRAEYLYGLELDKLNVLQNSLSAHELLSAIRGGYTQGLKR